MINFAMIPGLRDLHVPSDWAAGCVRLTCLMFAVQMATWTQAQEVVPESQLKPVALRGTDGAADEVERESFLRPDLGRSAGHQIVVGSGDSTIPLIVVRGTPYEMGYQLGSLIAEQMNAFIPAAMAGLTMELNLTQEDLREVWARTSAYTDDRVEQELVGLADGSGMPLSQLQAMHAVPVLMPYSCSSIAAWGDATRDGHLYQTRNLDWSLEVGAHEFPVIYVFGDGLSEKRAVKIRAHAPEQSDQRVMIWTDNDPSDEFAPNVLRGIVYNDEGRGAFPYLQSQHGDLDAKRLVGLCNKIVSIPDHLVAKIGHPMIQFVEVQIGKLRGQDSPLRNARFRRPLVELF